MIRKKIGTLRLSLSLLGTACLAGCGTAASFETISLMGESTTATTATPAVPTEGETDDQGVIWITEPNGETAASEAETPAPSVEEPTQSPVPETPAETKPFPQVVPDKMASSVLPVISITTDGGAEITSKTDYIHATFSMKGNGVEGFEDVEPRGIRIRGRGHSGWRYWPKKSFKMNFDEKISLMDCGKDKDWLLTCNYYDRTLSRNNLVFDLAKQFPNLQYTPDSHPVEVYLNGDYYGVYDLCEQVEVAGGRVAMAKDPTAEDSGFLLEVGGLADDPAMQFSVGLMKDVEIHYPKTVTMEQYNYITGYIAMVDNLITTGGNWQDYVDIDNVIDWMILQECTYNWDNGYERNMYLYKEPGGKMKFGPVWDCDLSLGSFGYDDSAYQTWATSANGLHGTTWGTFFLRDPAFVEKLRNRWLETRDYLYTYLIKDLAYYQNMLSEAFERNYQRWMLDVEGQNIRWEWPMEYEQRTLAGLMTYVRSVIDYRWQFLNRCLVDGETVPEREKEVFTHF